MAKDKTKGQVAPTTDGQTDDFMAPQSDAQVAADTAAAADAAAEASPAATRKDVVPSEYRERYAATGGNNGDFIAEELTIVTKDGGLPVLNSLKAENGIEATRWAGFNNGMIRMNIANVLRAAFLRGETIKIAGKEFSLAKSLDDYGKPAAHDNEQQIGQFLKYMNVADTDRNRKAVARAFGPKRDVAAEREAKKAATEAAKAEKAKAREAEVAAKKEEREKAAAAKAADREKANATKQADRDAARAKREEERAAAKAAKAPTNETVDA